MNQAQAIVNGSFELSALDDQTIDLSRMTHDVAVVEDADGNPLIGFRIVGKNSPEYMKVNSEIRRDNIKRAGKRKAGLDASTDDGADAIARTVDDNERKIAKAVIVGWFGFKLEGQDMEFSEQYVAKLLDKFPTWQTKVMNALEVEANFMKV